MFMVLCSYINVISIYISAPAMKTVINGVANLLYHCTYLSLLPSLSMLPHPLSTSSSTCFSITKLACLFVLNEHITSIHLAYWVTINC